MSDHIHSSGTRSFNAEPISHLQAPLNPNRGKLFYIDGQPCRNMSQYAKDHGWDPVGLREAVNAGTTFFGHDVSRYPPCDTVPTSVEAPPPAMVRGKGPLLHHLVTHRLGRSPS